MGLSAISTLVVALFSTATPADKVESPVGCWVADTKGTGNLALQPDRTYLFGPEKGRWAIQGEEIWLVSANRVGAKWRLAVTKDSLTLDRPEDFKYLGRANYLYFQMTHPKTVHSFKRSQSPDACQAPPKKDAEAAEPPAKKDGGKDEETPAAKD